MMPLNYAILRYMTTVPEACAEDIYQALAPHYPKRKDCSVVGIREALLTAEVNGLLEQSRCELDEHDTLRLYFRAHEEGRATIAHYIRD